MITIDIINKKADNIIQKEQNYNDYKNQLIRKAEQNYLYKIDKEDKELFKQNKQELEDDKKELELMILQLLTNTQLNI